MVFGDVVYVKSDGEAWKPDAKGTRLYPAVAMVIETISADAAGDFLLQGTARDDDRDWTVGAELYLHTTAGAMDEAEPSATDDVIQPVGVCRTNADTVSFNTSMDYVTHT